MKNKCATLYIDDAGLRLAVFRKGRPKTWAYLPFEAGLLTGLSISDQDKFLQELVAFLRAHKVQGQKFALGVNAVNALTRQITLPSLPKNLLDEAVVREARRLFPVPVEQLHLAWQTLPGGDDKVQVFIVALMRTGVDSLFQALKKAGVKVASFTVKPLALSRMVTGKALLVDVQAADMDVVVLADGTPQPVRSVSFPAEANSWQARFNIVLDEIDRTLQFYQANNPDKLLPQDLPVYVSGELAKRNKFWPRITERFGFDPTPLEASLPPAEGFDPQDYVINIALAQDEAADMAEPPATAINLLPLQYRIQTIKWERALAVPVGVALVGTIVALAMLIGSTSARITTARQQVEATDKVLQERQSQRQTLKKDLNTLEQSLADARQARTDVSGVLAALQEHATTLNDNLRTVDDLAGNGLTLLGISSSDREIALNGHAGNEDGILAYARSLQQSGRFAETVLANIAGGEKETTFKIRLLSQELQ